MKTLIKNGTIITAQEIKQAEILIDGEIIWEVGINLEPGDAQIIDAQGKLVLPGGVDAHVHLDLPMFGTRSADDHYTGGKAAAFGGTTTMIDFVSHDAGSLHDNIANLKKKAAANASIDYTFHMNITHFDMMVAQELAHLPDEGITSVKVFTAYNDRLRLDDQSIANVMAINAGNGVLTMLHAEDGDEIEKLVKEALMHNHLEPLWHARTRPASGAVSAFERIIAISQRTDAPLYIVHMNVAGEVDALTQARRQGVKVMGETCPQYLFFTEEALAQPDSAKFICSPPLRSKHDNQRLMQGLSDNEIQVIATDHCPFFYNGTHPIIYEGKPVSIPGKELGADDFTKIPNGLPGISDRMPILWTYGVGAGKLSPNQFVAQMCSNPAKVFGIYPQKGTIQAGSDADIAIWDPEKELSYGIQYSHQRTDYNLYEGWKIKGYPEKVFLRGKLIVDGENWNGKHGDGNFLKCGQGELI